MEDVGDQDIHDQIRRVLVDGKVKYSRNRRACMKRLMTVDEAREVCRNRTKWRAQSGSLCLPRQGHDVMLCMYECFFFVRFITLCTYLHIHNKGIKIIQ